MTALRQQADGAGATGAFPATRLAFFYAAIFAALGVQLPFWPVWLKAQGFDASDIGVMLSAGFVVKVVANPAIAQAVDRLGERRRPMLVLSLGAIASFALFAVVQGFWLILAVSVLSRVFYAALMPLGENLTMLTAYARKLDYGRIRLWGSLAFIVASVGAGRLIGGRDPDLILWLTLGALAALIVACITLPDVRTARPAGRSAPLRTLLGDRRFLLFLVAGSLVQTSHAALYGFGTLHWQAQGLGDDVIGWLWAEGVVAEVVLFAAGGAVAGRLGPAGLLVLGGLAGALRWTVTALSADLGVLVALQALHAFTFGAAHLGAMHYIARAVRPEYSATAQSLYSASAMGLALGIMTLASGALYEALGGGVFFVMAAIALLGALAALPLVGRARAPEN